MEALGCSLEGPGWTRVSFRFVQKIHGEGGEDGISKAHASSGAQTLEAEWTALKHPRCPHFPVGVCLSFSPNISHSHIIEFNPPI